MRNRIFPFASLSVAAIALASCTMTPAETARAADAKAATQAALGKELAGLTPTETKDCMDNYQSSSLKAYGGTLVYSVSRKLKYVNDTGGGCEAVERGDILVTKSPSGRLCRGDIARTVMPGSHVPSGSCALGSFVTYRAK
ncbi:hypothetical protein [Sphingomonas pruni]|uniref:hypothetical protein n=1 Tax=Sphingomonas pruni TaxID=40683 RepID=UPI000832EDA3|nr:hypothetical protein [Sphingomonas pruni]